jgi:CYTH domain-containing protein
LGQEIERKFLVNEGVPAACGPGTSLRQGYVLAGSHGEVRLRDAGGEYTLTVKTGAGLERGEWEVKLTREQFETLWPATLGRRLEKRRDRVPAGDLTYEIDRYSGALDGLVVVEVEFESLADAAAFSAPGWFAREVTGDSAYSNASLALTGLPPAKEPQA